MNRLVIVTFFISLLLLPYEFIYLPFLSCYNNMRSIREEIVMEFVVLTKVVLTKEECASFFNSFHLQNFGQSVE